MDFPLRYCAGGYETLARLRRLFVDRDPSAVLATMSVPSATRTEFKKTHAAGYCDYPDPEERARFWDACLRERASVHDDSVPSAYLTEMGQGLYGGLVGGQVQFLCDPASGWISSMVRPILRDWTEIDRLSFNRKSQWFDRYTRQMRVFQDAGRGKFGISHFVLVNHLNFVFELFGATETYQGLMDRPERIRQASEFAFQINHDVQRAFFESVGTLEGGTCSLIGQ